jgi:flagellar protein FlgJ
LPPATADAANARFTTENEINQVNSFQAALEAAAANGNHGEIKKAAIEFESFFLSQLFRQMRRTVDMFSPDDKSTAMDVYQVWFDDKIADLAANSGSIGLAQFIFRQMTSYGNTIDPATFYQIITDMNTDTEPEENHDFNE